MCDIFGYYLPAGATFDEIEAIMDGVDPDEISDGDCVECWQEEKQHVPATVGELCAVCAGEK